MDLKAIGHITYQNFILLCVQQFFANKIDYVKGGEASN